MIESEFSSHDSIVMVEIVTERRPNSLTEYQININKINSTYPQIAVAIPHLPEINKTFE